jgi:hypothetical protein
MRHSNLAVTVAIFPPPRNVTLGLYSATFRYDKLPMATIKRVPGASCDRPNDN